jgi:pyrroline-5-carboxylate reductase
MSEGVGAMRIAVLGGGVMGETLASGFLRYVTPAPDIVIAEKRPERAEELRRLHGVEIADTADAVRGADVVLLAVKPQDVPALLGEIGAAIAPGTLVVSIAAGIRTVTIEEHVPVGVDVVRAMPNTPARVDRGVTGLSPGAHCSAGALALAERLLASVGQAICVPESMQDAVTAVSGSGPAYVFFLAEAMTAAAVEVGLDVDTARRMVNHTILGAATLLEASGEPAETLRRNVTSPNGTTAAAIATLEELDVHGAVVAAVTAARDRSRELSGG